MVCLLDEIRRENDVCMRNAAASTCLGADPELDEFMVRIDLLLHPIDHLSSFFVFFFFFYLHNHVFVIKHHEHEQMKTFSDPVAVYGCLGNLLPSVREIQVRSRKAF